jgi:hypothetical protein
MAFESHTSESREPTDTSLHVDATKEVTLPELLKAALKEDFDEN